MECHVFWKSLKPFCTRWGIVIGPQKVIFFIILIIIMTCSGGGTKEKILKIGKKEVTRKKLESKCHINKWNEN